MERGKGPCLLYREPEGQVASSWTVSRFRDTCHRAVECRGGHVFAVAPVGYLQRILEVSTRGTRLLRAWKLDFSIFTGQHWKRSLLEWWFLYVYIHKSGRSIQMWTKTHLFIQRYVYSCRINGVVWRFDSISKKVRTILLMKMYMILLKKASTSYLNCYANYVTKKDRASDIWGGFVSLANTRDNSFPLAFIHGSSTLIWRPSCPVL